MVTYKLFGLPKDFSTERWERLKVDLNEQREMLVEVVGVQPYPIDSHFRTIFTQQLALDIEQRLNAETGRIFNVTPTTRYRYLFRIKRP